MARFKYTFQKIVDLKGSEKMQAEWLLSDAIALLRKEEEALAQFKDEQQQWELKLEHSVQQVTSLSEVLTINQYIEYFSECIKQKHEDIAHAIGVVEERRAQLAERLKDEKVWDKAKERALERFQHSVQLKEQNELDEMASIRYMTSAP